MATPRVLVYSATAGYRHDSIPVAISALNATPSIEWEFSEDPGFFTFSNLAAFDAVVFLHNSEEVLDQSGQAALAEYFSNGGVYTGIHSASACLFNDTDYANAVGAYFDYHPTLQPATFLKLEDHPATNVPSRWTFTEEVYYFRSDPRDRGATVLLTVDEGSYTSEAEINITNPDDAGSAGNYTMGSPHPIAWYIDTPRHDLVPGAKAGRSFYTSLGHLNETWRDETFLGHVRGGLSWALEGRSTRAYGVGTVGNGAAASGAASGSSSASASMSSSADAGSTANASPSTANPASSPASKPAGSATRQKYTLGAVAIAAAAAALAVL